DKPGAPSAADRSGAARSSIGGPSGSAPLAYRAASQIPASTSPVPARKADGSGSPSISADSTTPDSGCKNSVAAARAAGTRRSPQNQTTNPANVTTAPRYPA